MELPIALPKASARTFLTSNLPPNALRTPAVTTLPVTSLAHERGPSDELALQFEAVSQLPPAELAVVKDVLESLVIKYQSRRWEEARHAAATAPAKKATPKRAAHATAR
jgi:hypothetical protein